MSDEKCSSIKRSTPTSIASANFNPPMCSRKGIVFEKGEWWCRQHSPTQQAEAEERRHLRILRKVFGPNYEIPKGEL